MTIFQKVLCYALLAFIFLLLASIPFIITTAHGETTTKTNTFGAVVDPINPFVYFAGNVARDPAVFRCGEKKRVCTNVEFVPYGRPLLYPESILFCGNVAPAFIGDPRPMLVTYKRRATFNIDGVGCHDLQSVYAVSLEEGQ